MLEAAKVISIVKNTASYNDKKYLLKKNENIPELKEILRFIYDPYFKTGISTAKLTKIMAYASARPYIAGEEPFVGSKEIMRYLKRHNTGCDADVAMAARFINCTKAMYESIEGFRSVGYDEVIATAQAILTQDLQIGITAKTLNAVYGEAFIPTVGCMLGTKITDLPTSRIQWPCIVTEKLDGIRRILIKEDGVCHIYSRSGHEDTGLVDIMEEAQYLPDNRVYDGELLALGDFKDNVALRQASNSIANIKGIKHGICYNVFDMLPVEDFYAGRSEDNALTRKILLGATLMDESIQILEESDWPKLIAVYGVMRPLTYIRPVPILGLVKCLNDIDPIVEKIWARNGEGVMLNTASGYYEIKRSKNLIKVKHTEEITLPITGVFEGAGKYEGSLGGVVVNYKGYQVGVGSGFTDAQRRIIWADPDKFIGRNIEIDHFGESTNQQGTISLNCPIFKRFEGTEE